MCDPSLVNQTWICDFFFNTKTVERGERRIRKSGGKGVKMKQMLLMPHSHAYWSHHHFHTAASLCWRTVLRRPNLHVHTYSWKSLRIYTSQAAPVNWDNAEGDQLHLQSPTEGWSQSHLLWGSAWFHNFAPLLNSLPFPVSSLHPLIRFFQEHILISHFQVLLLENLI